MHASYDSYTPRSSYAWLLRPTGSLLRPTASLLRPTAWLGVLLLLCASLVVAGGPAEAKTAAWQPKPSPMTTPWTNQVPVDNPWAG